jgi:DNA polymerase
VVLDVPLGFGSLQEVNDIMAFPIHWAKGLPLRAETFEAEYYKKD